MLDKIVGFLMNTPWILRILNGIMACVIWLCALPFPAGEPQMARAITQDDFLKTSGRLIKNESGKGGVVYLRGTNAGGWLVHEEWMCATQAPDHKTIRDTLEARFGAAEREAMERVYREAFWQESDFDICAEMGMTTLRLPFLYWDVVDEDANLLPNAFEWLDWFVKHCAARGIYVILDLHGAFGSQNGQHHSGIINDGRQLYYNEANRAKTIKLWEEIARHYEGNPAIAGYGLLNEPENDTGRTGEMQWDYYDELYRAVRAIDPDHIIFLGACWDVSAMPQPKQYGWSNIVYEYHHYAWNMMSSTEGIVFHSSLEATREALQNFGVPTLIGEFTCFGNDEAWRQSLAIYNKLGMHWTTWTYKVRGRNEAGDPWWGIYEADIPQADIKNGSKEEILAIWRQTATEGMKATRLKGILEELL